MQFPFRWLGHSSAVYFLISGFLAAHLLLAPWIGLGVDEAHYALYGLRPDWSYFDHPPMVGWLHWLGLTLGHSEFFVRLPSMVLWTLILVLVWQLARRWYGALVVANLAVALLVFSPLIVVLGFGLVPDTPLIVVTLLTLLLVDRIDATDGRKLGHWLLLGGLLGVAGLSKYTAVFVALALLLSLAVHRRWHWLAHAGPWLAVVVAAVLVAPVFYWNWLHDWVSFGYQVDHGAKGDWSAVDSLRYGVILLVSYGPLLSIAGLIAVFKPELANPSMGRQLAVWIAVLLLLVALWSAGNGENLPHWTVLSWVLLAPAAANWLYVRAGVGKRVFSWLAGSLSLMLSVLVWWLLIAPPLSSLPKTAQAVRDLHGWPEASHKALALREQWQTELPGPVHFWVSNWTQGSRLAWYAGAPVQVMSEKTSQFTLWWGRPTLPGLLLRAERRKPAQSAVVAPAGVQCELIDTLDYRQQGVTLNYFMYYRCLPHGQAAENNKDNR